MSKGVLHQPVWPPKNDILVDMLKSILKYVSDELNLYEQLSALFLRETGQIPACLVGDDRSPDPCLFNPPPLRILHLQRCVLSVFRPTIAMLPSEAGPQPAPAHTIQLSGVASLPRFPSPAGHANPSEIRVLSWVQTSREVDKSVFGQVVRHLSHR